MMNQRNKKQFGNMDSRNGATSKGSAQRRAIGGVRADQIQSGRRLAGL